MFIRDMIEQKKEKKRKEKKRKEKKRKERGKKSNEPESDGVGSATYDRGGFWAVENEK